MKPDDDLSDFVDTEPTRFDDSRKLADAEPETGPYKTAEFLAGRQAGLKEGIELAVSALKVELVRAGCTDAEVREIVARVQGGIERR